MEVLRSCSVGCRAGQCTLLPPPHPLMPCPLIFPVTTAPHRNRHNLCRGVLPGTPHFKGAYLLLENLEKVQLWMHPPTSINDRAAPPDPPPCWLIKCFLGSAVSWRAVWAWFKLALRWVSIVCFLQIAFAFFFSPKLVVAQQSCMQDVRISTGRLPFILADSIYFMIRQSQH